MYLGIGDFLIKKTSRSNVTDSHLVSKHDDRLDSWVLGGIISHLARFLSRFLCFNNKLGAIVPCPTDSILSSFQAGLILKNNMNFVVFQEATSTKSFSFSVNKRLHEEPPDGRLLACLPAPVLSVEIDNLSSLVFLDILIIRV